MKEREATVAALMGWTKKGFRTPAGMAERYIVPNSGIC